MSPTDGAPASELDALLEAVGLKALPRAGWVRRGLPAVESVAGHAWGVSWLVLALLPEELDRERALTYAVLHDLPEVRAGDVTPHDGVDPRDKAAAEARALEALTAPLARGPDLRAAWHAYEAQADPEARFVRECDRLDMALQAVAYARTHRVDLTEFLDSAARIVTHPALRPLLEGCRARLADLSRGDS